MTNDTIDIGIIYSLSSKYGYMNAIRKCDPAADWA